MKNCVATAAILILILVSLALARDGNNIDLMIGKQNINLKELISKSNFDPYATDENENTFKKEINYNLNNIINSRFEGSYFGANADKEIISINDFENIIIQMELENRNHDYNEIVLDNLDIYQRQFEIDTLFREIIDESYLYDEIDMQIPQMVSFAI